HNIKASMLGGDPRNQFPVESSVCSPYEADPTLFGIGFGTGHKNRQRLFIFYMIIRPVGNTRCSHIGKHIRSLPKSSFIYRIVKMRRSVMVVVPEKRQKKIRRG